MARCSVAVSSSVGGFGVAASTTGTSATGTAGEAGGGSAGELCTGAATALPLPLPLLLLLPALAAGLALLAATRGGGGVEAGCGGEAWLPVLRLLGVGGAGRAGGAGGGGGGAALGFVCLLLPDAFGVVFGCVGLAGAAAALAALVLPGGELLWSEPSFILSVSRASKKRLRASRSPCFTACVCSVLFMLEVSVWRVVVSQNVQRTWLSSAIFLSLVARASALPGPLHSAKSRTTTVCQLLSTQFTCFGGGHYLPSRDRGWFVLVRHKAFKVGGIRSHGLLLTLKCLYLGFLYTVQNGAQLR